MEVSFCCLHIELTHCGVEHCFPLAAALKLTVVGRSAGVFLLREIKS